MHFKTIAPLFLIPLAAACVPSPSYYETDPVEVQTTRGAVTCQLYTLDRIEWDRAIDYPSAMGASAADGICRGEGQRIIDARRAGKTPA